MAGCWYIMGSLWPQCLRDPRAFGYAGRLLFLAPGAQFSCLWLQERVPTSHCGAPYCSLGLLLDTRVLTHLTQLSSSVSLSLYPEISSSCLNLLSSALLPAAWPPAPNKAVLSTWELL